MADKLEQLERLGKLHDEGRITDAEFEALKAEILDPQASLGAEGSPTPPATSSVAPTMEPTTADPTQALGEAVQPVVTGTGGNSPRIQPATKRGVGWVLLALGVLSAVVVAWNEVAALQSSSTSDTKLLAAVLLGFVINPLVWLGVFGAFWVVRNPRSVSGASRTVSLVRQWNKSDEEAASGGPTSSSSPSDRPLTGIWIVPTVQNARRPPDWDHTRAADAEPTYLANHASSPNADIRRNVAEHPNTPEGVIRALARDKKWTVRAGVTYNENVPTDVLEELRNDSYDSVRTRAVKALSSRT